MKTIEEKVAVYRAWLEGKEIEFASDLCKWEPAPSPSWDWHNFDYRVKPKLLAAASDSSTLLEDYPSTGKGLPSHHQQVIVWQIQRYRDRFIFFAQ